VASCLLRILGYERDQPIKMIKMEDTTMMLEKRRLTLQAMESQTALELPYRHMLSLVNVTIRNVLNGLHVTVIVKNNNVAVQVCAAVQAINNIIAPTRLTCRITQT
jgi:hypothetical protein